MRYINARKRYFLIMLMFLFTLNCYSQGTATGCLLPNNRVYTSEGMFNVYRNDPSTGLSVDYCRWTPNSGVRCDVCNGMLNVEGMCLVGSTPGIENTFSMVHCPIDSNVYILILIIAGTGGYFISRKTFV